MRYVVIESVEPGSPAAQSGIREDDIVLSINRARISDVDDMKRVIDAGPNGEILLNIQRGNRAYFVLLK